MLSPSLARLAALFLLTSFTTAQQPDFGPFALDTSPHQHILHQANEELIAPVTLYKTSGKVQNASSLLSDSVDTAGSALFLGPSTAIYDFGTNITGRVALRIGEVDKEQYIGLSYHASPPSEEEVRGEEVVRAMGALKEQWLHPTGPGNFSVVKEQEVHDFRFLGLVHNSTGGIQVQRILVFGKRGEY